MSTIRQDLTQKSGPGILLGELAALMGAHRQAFGQERLYLRGWSLLLGWLFTFSRKTLTQLLVALGSVEQDWTAWYRLLSRRRIDYDGLTRTFLRETLRHVKVDEFYRTTIDATPIPRHSRTMPGTFWGRVSGGLGFRANLRRIQRFVNLAWFIPEEQGYTRAVPLRWFTALPPKAVAAEGEPLRKEWEAGLAALQWTRRSLDEEGRSEQWLMTVADGSYDVNDIWEQLPEKTVLVVRCAKNRRLYELPKRKAGRGRPAVYGEPAPHPREWLHQPGKWEQTTLEVRGKRRPLKYRVKGPYVVEGGAEQPVFLLVVKGYSIRNRAGQAMRYRPPSYLLINAVKRASRWQMPMDTAEVLTWAWQRWEVEVCHRELKTSFGLGELQCWSKYASILSVQWVVWMYAVLVLAGYRAWGLLGDRRPPPGRWGTSAHRWSLTTLWQGYRQELWQPGEFRALCLGSPDNWLEKPPLLRSLRNAAQGAMRG